MKDNEPKGFTCECGTFHPFGVYVMAHWDEALTHTCDTCGRQHSVRSGRVHQTKGPRKVVTNER